MIEGEKSKQELIGGLAQDDKGAQTPDHRK